MTLQTIEQVLPLLELIQQPAFCIANYGSVFCNPPARLLAPVSAQDLPYWLDSGMEVYEQWDRSSNLLLPVSIGTQILNATIQPLADGTLFLLSPCATFASGSGELGVTAQVLRQPLNDLFSMAQQISETLEEAEDPLLLQQTAAMSRHIYRLTRIACDLADLDQLRSGTYPVRAQLLDLGTFLQEFTLELSDLCNAAGFVLRTQLPEKQLLVNADSVLLERALLNLISNAMKYGNPKDPICLTVEAAASSVYFRVQNTAAKENSDVMIAAFQRLTQRGMLPDPQWGIGLGLPLALSIARNMGGTIAVEERAGQVLVTMSLSRKRDLQNTDVRTTPSYDYTGGMRRTLVELADVLPPDCYDSTVI